MLSEILQLRHWILHIKPGKSRGLLRLHATCPLVSKLVVSPHSSTQARIPLPSGTQFFGSQHSGAQSGTSQLPSTQSSRSQFHGVQARTYQPSSTQSLVSLSPGPPAIQNRPDRSLLKCPVCKKSFPNVVKLLCTTSMFQSNFVFYKFIEIYMAYVWLNNFD